MKSFVVKGAGVLAAVPDLQSSLAVWRSQIDANATPAEEAAARKSSPQAMLGRHPGNWEPSALFNAMIAPLTRYTIEGAIWYQGESSADPTRAGKYAEVFPLLIKDWRKQWDEPRFPFIIVQISSFIAEPEMSWGTVRDAQRRALSLPNTDLAPGKRLS